MKPIATSSATLIAALLVAAAVSAGSTTGGISGVVKDASGQVVADAEVILKEVGFGTTLKLRSDAKGKFLQIGIKPGDYEVTASKAGVGESVVKTHLRLGTPTPLEVVLGQGAAAPGSSAAAPGAAAAAAAVTLEGVKVSKEAQAAFLEAQAAMAAGDKATAKAALERLVAADPLPATPYFVLAQIERDAGDGKKAVERLQQGLERKPDDVSAWIALGEVQSDLGEPEAAVKAFRKAAEIAPADPLPYKKLAMALVIGQDFPAAVTALETYLKLAPDAADAAEKQTLLDELRKTAARK